MAGGLVGMITKMFCIFAMESVKKMGGNRGKMSSMAGHAFLHSYWDATNDYLPFEVRHVDKKAIQASAYRTSGMAYKITLVVPTVDDLIALQEAYKDVCGTSLVTDAGLTVFGEPTTVCLGIGPIFEENIGDDLKALKVFL
jgi:peptidyl-tRNA hydrolase